jgi:adenylyltransferase/sulfurtransferase
MNPQDNDIVKVGAEECDMEDRTRRYFGSLYPRLQQHKVLVVGAGAVGTEVVKNLVMVGVKNLTLVDFDKVAASNLNRCVFFRPEDHGKTYKVDAIVREVRAIWPHVHITGYPVAIQDAPEEIWESPVVIVAVDNNEARYFINLRTLSCENPPFVINGALGRTFIEVHVLHPGHTACLICPWSEEYVQKLWQKLVRQKCDQFFFETVEKFPAISFLNSLAGAMMASETVKILVGLELWRKENRWEEEHVPMVGKCLRYDLRLHEFSVGTIHPNPQCAEVFCRQRQRR